MIIELLDQNLQTRETLDAFNSFIWTDRYYKCGDFEITLIPDSKVLERFKLGYYIWQSESKRLMIIEGVDITTNAENGDTVTIKGRSIESLLDRRIVWDQTIIDSDVQYGVEKILNENVIAPSDSRRTMPRIVFKYNPSLPQMHIRAQFTGDSVYEVMTSICEACELGFKMELNNLDQFEFSLYAGADRSFNQDTNDYVIFSPDFDNLISSDFKCNKSNYKTTALVAGEGEGSERRKIECVLEEVTGFDRRELFVDARDLSSNPDSETPISDEEYFAQLEERGIEKLAEHQIDVAFDGELANEVGFVYNRDFFMGDIVQIENEYGFSKVSRVIELITSVDDTGFKQYPTFTAEY